MYALHAHFQVRIKMVNVVITLRVMPESPNVNLENLQKKVLNKINKFTGNKETKTEIEPVAFGLKALKIIFVMDENKGSTEKLENKINLIDGVKSVEVIDVRRAIG